jgi:UDP-galactopyranose mutase
MLHSGGKRVQLVKSVSVCEGFMLMKGNKTLVIVGAGPVGCTVARVVSEAGFECDLFEKRSHIAGNCYDEVDDHGVLIHRYGPHCFRTNSDSVFQLLSRFTEWLPSQYVVKSLVGGELYPFPINLETLEMVFKKKLDATTAMQLLNEVRDTSIVEARNSEELVLSKIGPKLYEMFYRDYTRKQWGRSAAELAPSVCGRIPVRLDRYHGYVESKYMQTPAKGFTHLFSKMLDHPRVRLHLNCTDNDWRPLLTKSRVALYTGPIDSFFLKKPRTS